MELSYTAGGLLGSKMLDVQKKRLSSWLNKADQITDT